LSSLTIQQNKKKKARMTMAVIILIAIIFARPIRIFFETIVPIIGTPLEWLGINATLLLIATTSALLYLQVAYSYRNSFSLSVYDCIMVVTLGTTVALLTTWTTNDLSIAKVAFIIYVCTFGAAMMEIKPSYPLFSSQ